ncbi:MAG: 50S ribosomal protein L11 methyltransferase [Gammaproteobacteria bacterium]|nr:50S ribosomal protein L11 methyltransferase [Gammaproteobacteria bacterium]
MLQISVTIDRAQLLSTEQALLDHGACSVTLRDAADDPVLEPLPGEAPLWPTVIVTALFDDDMDFQPLQRMLNGMLARQPPLEIERVAKRDWPQLWKQDCATLSFGRCLRVRRGDSPENNGIGNDGNEPNTLLFDLFLDPGLAFGTGDHPTTALCLEWLDANPPRDREVIDYGCGSGILGLAALKLGARRVYAVDIDPQALVATRDNAARNGIGTRALLTLNPAELPMLAADLLLANIVARPLMVLAQTFATCVMPGGCVVLSGLLTDQADAVAAVYAPWFTFSPAHEKDGWSLLAGHRRPANR